MQLILDANDNDNDDGNGNGSTHIHGVISMRVVAHAHTSISIFLSYISAFKLCCVSMYTYLLLYRVSAEDHKFDFRVGADGSTAMRLKLYCIVYCYRCQTYTTNERRRAHKPTHRLQKKKEKGKYNEAKAEI